MKRKLITKSKAEIDYEKKYGDIPNDTEKYIREKYKIDDNKLEEAMARIDILEWKELMVVLPIVPRPTPRPRLSTTSNHFYVKGAAENKRVIQKYIKDHDIIFTRTELTVDTYQPTPTSSMTNVEILLAERKLIRPMTQMDFDNLGKTYADMLGDVLLLNDAYIVSGIVNKYYSVLPRVEIIIRYQDGFDSKYNYKKVTSTKAFITKGLVPIEY